MLRICGVLLYCFLSALSEFTTPNHPEVSDRLCSDGLETSDYCRECDCAGSHCFWCFSRSTSLVDGEYKYLHFCLNFFSFPFSSSTVSFITFTQFFIFNISFSRLALKSISHRPCISFFYLNLFSYHGFDPFKDWGRCTIPRSHDQFSWVSRRSCNVAVSCSLQFC